VRVSAGTAARVDFLLRDYEYFVADPARLKAQLDHLRTLQGHETVDRWLGLVADGDFRTLVGELLEKHYDPLYQRSQSKNYADYGDAPGFATDDLTPEGITRLAREILAA
jgi:tRNA 2-selenouridine synthase